MPDNTIPLIPNSYCANLNNLPVALAVLDRNCIFVKINDAYQKEYALKIENTIGQHIKVSLPKVSWFLIKDHISLLLRTKKAVIYQEEDLECSACGVLQVVLMPELDVEGEVLGFSIMRIPALKGVKQEKAEGIALFERMDAMSKYSSSLAHDFNNKLAGVTGIAELALCDEAFTNTEKGERYSNLLEIAKEQTIEFTAALEKFANTTVIQTETFDLKVLIENFISNCDHEVDNVRGGVHVIHNAENSIVKGHESEILKTLKVIFSYMSSQVSNDGITIYTENVILNKNFKQSTVFDIQEGEHIRLQLKCKINEEYCIYTPLFEPYSLKNMHSVVENYSLAIAYRNIINHKGIISSSCLNNALRIKIVLPCDMLQGKDVVADTGDINTGKVIIVDSDELCARSFEAVFRTLGCEAQIILDDDIAEEALIRSKEDVSLVILGGAEKGILKNINKVKSCCANSKVVVSSYQPNSLNLPDDIIVMHKPAILKEVKNLFVAEDASN